MADEVLPRYRDQYHPDHRHMMPDEVLPRYRDQYHPDHRHTMADEVLPRYRDQYHPDHRHTMADEVLPRTLVNVNNVHKPDVAGFITRMWPCHFIMRHPRFYLFQYEKIWWVPWTLLSGQPHDCLLSCLFNMFKAQIKENIKALHHRWIPHTKGQ